MDETRNDSFLKGSISDVVKRHKTSSILRSMNSRCFPSLISIRGRLDTI